MAKKLSAYWTAHKIDIERALLVNRASILTYGDVLKCTLKTLRAVIPLNRVDWDFPDVRLMEIRYYDCPQGQHAITTICVPPEHHVTEIKRKGRQWMLQWTFSPVQEENLFVRRAQRFGFQIGAILLISQQMVRDLKLVESNLIDINQDMVEDLSEKARKAKK